MIKLLIADDHALIRAGLRKIVERDKNIHVIAEVESAEELLESLQNNDCDIITLDINLRDKNGLDIIPDILRINPDVKILALSIMPEERYAIKALRLGAMGYLTKDSTPEELLKAINLAHEGKKYISEELANILVNVIDGAQKKFLHEKLSERELEILQLIGRGQSVNEIAGQLFISPNTVRTYRSRIIEKLNLHKAADLIHYAINHNLV